MASFQNAQAHFERCGALLQSGDLASLFYACLEYRFCVEARLHEYAERADDVTGKSGKRWKVRDLANHVDKTFGEDDQTYKIEIRTRKHPEPRVIKYTPITPEVRSICGKLNNFLHYAGLLQCVNEGKEARVRTLLQDGLNAIQECLSGTMQGPVLKNPDGTLSMQFVIESFPELAEDLKQGGEFHLSISTDPYENGDQQGEDAKPDNAPS